MTITLCGPAVLENPHQVEGSTCMVELDGQLWLGPGNILTGKFHYFNMDDITFNNVGYYVAWIHVSPNYFTMGFCSC
jgi:hypothetical protein